MESASKQDYRSLMKEQVFAPLNMTSTMPEPPSHKPSTLVKAYWNDKGRLEKPRLWRDVNLSHRLAAGGIISTSSDLARLGAAYLDEDFISEDLREKMWTPQRLTNGEVNEQSYALGWRVRNFDENSDKVIIHANHGGVTRGNQSWLMVVPYYELSIAVNINSTTEKFWDFASVSHDIAKNFICNFPKEKLHDPQYCDEANENRNE
jgi:CubicO group peptidase (beta-lactamase class C family)